MTNNKNGKKNELMKYKTEIIKELNVKNDIFAKVQIIGDTQVGKTSFLSKLTTNNFPEKYQPTIGYEFTPYIIKLNEKIIKFQLWDMCGNENYRSVIFNLYRNASLGILIYSICSRNSYNNLEKWISKLKKYAAPWNKLILIGNKCDNDDKREVTFEEGKRICDKFNLLFFMETSAKDGFNISKILESAAIYLYEDYEKNNKTEINNLSTTLTTESILLKTSTFKTKNKNCC